MCKQPCSGPSYTTTTLRTSENALQSCSKELSYFQCKQVVPSHGDGYYHMWDSGCKMIRAAAFWWPIVETSHNPLMIAIKATTVWSTCFFSGRTLKNHKMGCSAYSGVGTCPRHYTLPLLN